MFNIVFLYSLTVEGIGYPLQYTWASLVAQMVKNLPARWETWVRSLDWEGPLEEGIATQFSILAWRIPMDSGAWRATVHGIIQSWTRLSNLACINLIQGVKDKAANN